MKDYKYCTDTNKCIHRRGCKRWVGNYKGANLCLTNSVNGNINTNDCITSKPYPFSDLDRFRGSDGSFLKDAKVYLKNVEYFSYIFGKVNKINIINFLANDIAEVITEHGNKRNVNVEKIFNTELELRKYLLKNEVGFTIQQEMKKKES